MKYDKPKSSLAEREQKALLERNHPLVSLVDDLGASIQVIDPYSPGFPFLYVNKGFTKITGYSVEEAIGCSHTLLQGGDTDPSDAEDIDHTIENQEIATIEILNYHRDGTPFWIELHMGPINDSNGEVLYYIGFQNDISKRKIAERQLKENEQRYQSLFHNNPELICSFDLDGKILSANPAVEAITGYCVDEVVKWNFDNFIIEEDRKKTYDYFLKVADGNPQKVELRIRHKNGEPVDLEVTGVPIIIDGKTVGVYAIAKDVTEYNTTQELLKRAEKLGVVGELAAGIAHEIRNPLTSLKGFIQLLRPDLERKKAYTDVMLSEIERIEQIVTELLLLARPRDAEFKEKDLCQLLEHVRTLMSTKAIMSNIEIVLDYKCAVECIYCEENQLKQVLINLLKNAIEAMSSGGRINMEAVELTDEQVMIRVIDEGEGIPEESLLKLGEPFYTTKEQGTGLGLMISWKIIKEHGGTMEFKSPPNEGTTVEIILPVSPERPKHVDSTYQISE